MNKKAAELARQAADAHQDATGRQVLVAGSMGPTGELFAPLGMLDHDTAVAAFSDQANALAEGGVDLLWIETISSIEEVQAAVEAAQKTGLPIAATMTFDTAGKSMMGVNPDDYARACNAEGLAAVGANCGIGPAELMHSVLLMKDQGQAALVAKGNCGIPEYRDGAIHYHGSPELMAQYAALARDAGSQIIGGCCGTTPDHIRAMREAIDTAPKRDHVDLSDVTAILSEPWKDIPKNDAAPRRRRRRD